MASKGVSFLCVLCKMKEFDPLNRVERVISDNFIVNISNEKFKGTINLKEDMKKFNVRNSNLDIELRCVRIDSGDVMDITWPDDSFMTLNSEKVIEFPALSLNSSTKKRKDFAVSIGRSISSFVPKSCLENMKL